MKLYTTYLLFMIFSVVALAQPQIDDFQEFSRDILRTKKVKVIRAYEKEYVKPYYDYKMIIIPDSAMLAEAQEKGTLQSIEEFDTLGRIVHKENFWQYSDLGHVMYNYSWNVYDKIQFIEYFKDTTMQVKEEFFYDTFGSMVLWKVRVFEQGMILFKKYENDQKGNPVRINIFMGKDKIREDSVAYVYDNLNRIVTERGFDQKGINIDSIAYRYNMGDTLLLQEFFMSGKPDKIEMVRENRLHKTFQRIQFSDGDFMGSSYDIFDKKGNISKKRNIHHYSQLNYEKQYFYSPDGIPIIKKVYKNGEEPETIVTFEVEYYN